MSRALLRRVQELERRLLMSEADDAELASFDWDGPLALSVAKHMGLSLARHGVTLEDHADRSWHLGACRCQRCVAYGERLAPLDAQIEASKRRGAEPAML